MATINCPTRKVNPKQPKTPLPFCYAYYKEPLPIERFLGIAYRKRGRTLRKSTRTIGITLFHTLRKGPSIVNIAQLARDTGYSTPTVNKALAYFSRFGKIQRIHERRTGKRRPCMYKLHDSFVEKPEPRNIQEKARCGVSVNSHSIEPKDIKPTKGPCPSFSIESLKNTPKNQQLNQADKRRLSFFARRSCQSEVVSAVLSVLWQRDAVAGIWLDAIQGLRNLSIDERATELVWRARKGIAALIGGLDREGFEAIMEDKPATEQEAIQRDLNEIDRRLRGLEKWGVRHGCTSWFVEKRAELEKERYRTDLPCGICTDGFFTTISEPQPQRVRVKRFKLTGFYTANRQPLQGEALQKRKAAARKALNDL